MVLMRLFQKEPMVISSSLLGPVLQCAYCLEMVAEG